MTTSASIAFIGAGNMAQCIIKGLLQQGYPPECIGASNRNEEKLSAMRALSIHVTSDNLSLLDHDIVVLSVKPQHMKQLAQAIGPQLKTKVLVSLAAGITTTQLEAWCGEHPTICRVMPNTPAQLGLGITALYSATDLSNWRETLNKVFQAIGEVIWIEEESQMDIVTALSGSGPAYLYYLLESLIEGATQLGLPKQTAQTLALKTVYGASVMALSHPGPLATLREQVTSKGGTTESGLSVLKSYDLPEIIAKTLQAATERGKTLSSQYS